MMTTNPESAIARDAAVDRPASAGEAVLRDDLCSLTLVRRLAAMLDHDPDGYAEGDPLPRGWHQIYFSADTPQSELKPDGMMSLGVRLPQIDLPRLVMGGRRTDYLHDIPIGARITRESIVHPVVRKTGRSGALAIVTVEHRIGADPGNPAIVEQQDYIYRAAAAESGAAAVAEPPSGDADFAVPFRPDETMVFRYSALTYNTHRIHFDYPYATGQERYPGIVVNGGLTTLMLVEALKRVSGPAPRRVVSRNRGILVLGRTAWLKGRREGERWICWAEADGAVVLEADVS